MKAIETTYHGPGNVRGARIWARDLDGNRVSVPYDHGAGSTEDAHAVAAMALCAKMGWTGDFVAGATKRGYVFVFVDRWTKYYNTAGSLPREIVESA